MNIDFEFHMTLADETFVGEFTMALDWLPPLGSLVHMHGVRFTVSDVDTITAIVTQPPSPRWLESKVKVECSCLFETDDAFLEALCKLVYGEVRFDEDALMMVEDEADDGRTLPRKRHLRKATG